jgi:hypothetical protein
MKKEREGSLHYLFLLFSGDLVHIMDLHFFGSRPERVDHDLAARKKKAFVSSFFARRCPYYGLAFARAYTHSIPTIRCHDLAARKKKAFARAYTHSIPTIRCQSLGLSML